MEIRLHDDVERFAELAGPLLAADSVRHTLALTVLDGLRRGHGEAALLLTAHRREAVAGAALRTRGWPVIASALPPALAVAADRAAAAVDPEPPGVNGPVDEVRAYAAAVVARTGATQRTAMAQRLFRLLTLTPPAGVAGCARTAHAGDFELLVGWTAAFQQEAVPELHPPADPRPMVKAALDRGGYLLWETEGCPVAFAVARPAVAGMSRVGPVYTPPEHRGRGFGSAVTAAASAWARQAGAREVVLFTDLANPVSNSIYPKVGYRAVMDTAEIRFEHCAPSQ